MKREYERESIPSQSLAQQDEPVQQMNSHEAGEEMPTRTLFKKLKTYSKTYSRRKLLKGTTSTNPSKSASPAGSTPANEDRTRTDNQVAADDTPFSAVDTRFSTPANEDRTRADNQVAAADTSFFAPANEDRTRADSQVAAVDTPFSTPANEDRTRADNQVAAVDTPFSTPANEDRTRADSQVAAVDIRFSTPANKDRTRADNQVAADDTPFFAPANEDRTRADSQVAAVDTPFSTPTNEDRTRADNQVASVDTPFSTPDNEDRTRADSQVAAVDTRFSTPANEDRTRADNQVAADDTPFFAPANEDRTREDNRVAVDDTPFSTFDKDGVKFDNVEDFFARVSGQIKRAQSLGFSADQSSPMDDKISAMQKSTPSAEMLASAKADLKRLLSMPSQYMLVPENCSALSAALSVYAAAPDLPAERALAMKKLKEDLPHFFVTLRRAQKYQAEYYKESAKNILLINELRKDQELYTLLKDCSDKLEYQISMMEASLKDAKTKLEAIQQQQLNLARRCFQKSSAFDKFEAEFPVLKEIKKLADADTARLEESLKDFRSRIMD